LAEDGKLKSGKTGAHPAKVKAPKGGARPAPKGGKSAPKSPKGRGGARGPVPNPHGSKPKGSKPQGPQGPGPQGSQPQPIPGGQNKNPGYRTPEPEGPVPKPNFPPAVGTKLSFDKTIVLNQINAERAKYCQAPLKYDDALAEVADTWASQCVFGHADMHFPGQTSTYYRWFLQQRGETRDDHTMFPTHECGENGAFGYNDSTGWIAEDASGYCHGLACKEPQVGIPLQGCGHWTALVWNVTQMVGCAYYSCSNGCCPTAFFCNFWPPGNNANVQGTMAIPPFQGSSACQGKC